MMFKIGKIRVSAPKKGGIKVGGPTIIKTEEEPAAEPVVIDANGKEYPEVTSVVEAIAILKGEYGVSATRLKSEASVMRVAVEKNVSFPNLKF
jgi:hypothetical protein